MFRRTPSRWSRSPGCCGFRGVFWVRRDFVFFSCFYFERTRPAASMSSPCLIYLSTGHEARPRERSNRGRLLPSRQKSLFIPGCAQGAIIYLVCRWVCVCVFFVVLTDCESCTRPISTNAASMEVGEYGLTREKCFFARRLEMVAVAWLLRVSW